MTPEEASDFMMKFCNENKLNTIFLCEASENPDRGVLFVSKHISTEGIYKML